MAFMRALGESHLCRGWSSEAEKSLSNMSDSGVLAIPSSIVGSLLQ
jgi:hypothetical protein